MTREELQKQIEKARKNVRYMSKSGQKDTVHHQLLAKLEAQLEKPPKKSEGKGFVNG